MTPHLLSLDRQGLEALFADLGEKPFRARQLWQWLHAKRVSEFDDMTNLAKDLRQQLAGRSALRVLEARDHLTSRDGLTEKWLFRVAGHKSQVSGPRSQVEEPTDGKAESTCDTLVETVLIREQRLRRATVCVSCMSGCPLGCVFCATGQDGFQRNLSAGEMLEQVYVVDAHARGDEARGISNVVFMGMGEPLLNYDAVLTAARTLAHAEGLALSGRHITLSTVGVVEGIRRLTQEGVNFRLAVSLHAPDQALREELMPATKAWPLADLLDALHLFAETASRDITLEYCLIDDMNASLDHAHALADLLQGLACKVNLIPLNPVAGFAGRPPEARAIRAFQTVLDQAGIAATLRTEKGQDIQAACGQLRSRRLATDAEETP